MGGKFVVSLIFQNIQQNIWHLYIYFMAELCFISKSKNEPTVRQFYSPKENSKMNPRLDSFILQKRTPKWTYG